MSQALVEVQSEEKLSRSVQQQWKRNAQERNREKKAKSYLEDCLNATAATEYRMTDEEIKNLTTREYLIIDRRLQRQRYFGGFGAVPHCILYALIALPGILLFGGEASTSLKPLVDYAIGFVVYFSLYLTFAGLYYEEKGLCSFFKFWRWHRAWRTTLIQNGHSPPTPSLWENITTHAKGIWNTLHLFRARMGRFHRRQTHITTTERMATIVETLEQELEQLGCTAGSTQLHHLKQRIGALTAILKSKFRQDELTHRRYQDAVNRVYGTIVDALGDVVTKTRSINAIDIEASKSVLENLPQSKAEEIKRLAFLEQQNLYEGQVAGIEGLLANNETLMVEIDKVAVELSKLRSQEQCASTDDHHSALQDLQTLIEQVTEYE